MKRIDRVIEVSSSPDGVTLRVHLLFEDRSSEWVEVDHDHVGQVISSIIMAAEHARTKRPRLTPAGNPMPIRYASVDVDSVAVLPKPEAGELVIRFGIHSQSEAYCDFGLDETLSKGLLSLLSESVPMLSGPSGRPPPQH